MLDFLIDLAITTNIEIIASRLEHGYAHVTVENGDKFESLLNDIEYTRTHNTFSVKD